MEDSPRVKAAIANLKECSSYFCNGDVAFESCQTCGQPYCDDCFGDEGVCPSCPDEERPADVDQTESKATLGGARMEEFGPFGHFRFSVEETKGLWSYKITAGSKRLVIHEMDAEGRQDAIDSACEWIMSEFPQAVGCLGRAMARKQLGSGIQHS